MITVQTHHGFYCVKFEHFEGSDFFTITDAHVAKLYPNLRVDLILEPGESSKDFVHYQQVIAALADARVQRKSTVVALGGGVIGDLVGFAAATYMRGIRFIQVPTTLLAQVDSSVGGKVGIDLAQGKNLVGAFYPPCEVIVDTRFIQSLPLREFRCGLAEVLKYGLILDQELWNQLIASPLTALSTELSSVIERCIRLKADVVESDEFETKGERAKLNFGHTVGHAIEVRTGYEKYTHGEAISLGMVAESWIAEKMGIAKRGLSEAIQTGLVQNGLPVRGLLGGNPSDLVQSMKLDKKSENGTLVMSLVTDIGTCELVKDVPESVVVEVLSEMSDDAGM
jgi:3-dehydroquinate synthase